MAFLHKHVHVCILVYICTYTCIYPSFIHYISMYVCIMYLFVVYLSVMCLSILPALLPWKVLINCCHCDCVAIEVTYTSGTVSGRFLRNGVLQCLLGKDWQTSLHVRETDGSAVFIKNLKQPIQASVMFAFALYKQ